MLTVCCVALPLSATVLLVCGELATLPSHPLRQFCWFFVHLPAFPHHPTLQFWLVFLCRAALPPISQDTFLSLRFRDLAECSMPLSCVGELITVSSTKFTRVHKSFSERRERLRCANIYPTILGHLHGREELI